MITWKKRKTTPEFHEQWDSIDANAIVRKCTDFEYEAWMNGKYLGRKPNLTAAKKLVHNACVGKVRY